MRAPCHGSVSQFAFLNHLSLILYLHPVWRRHLFFKALCDYPRLVGLVHNVVTACLKEEGVLD